MLKTQKVEVTAPILGGRFYRTSLPVSEIRGRVVYDRTEVERVRGSFARGLLGIQGVERVVISSEMVSIMKTPDGDWARIDQAVRALFTSVFKEVVFENQKSKIIEPVDPERFAQVRERELLHFPRESDR